MGQIFEKLFITCVEIIIKLKICKCSTVGFELQTLKFKNLRLRQSRHSRLSHVKTSNELIINLYSLLIKKFQNSKKSKVEVKIWNLINYSTVCCQIQSGSMVDGKWYIAKFEGHKCPFMYYGLDQFHPGTGKA